MPTMMLTGFSPISVIETPVDLGKSVNDASQRLGLPDQIIAKLLVVDKPALSLAGLEFSDFRYDDRTLLTDRHFNTRHGCG
jgi:hypothetical protein